MGIIKRGILGGFSGKVANVVGSSWKGIAVMKSLPLSVANPRTAGQVTQRSKFGSAAKVGSILLTNVIKPFWDRFAQQASGFNDWLQTNIDFFDAGGLVNEASVVMSKGVIEKTDITSQDSDTGAAVCSLYFTDDSGSGNRLATDIMKGIVYNETKDVWGFSTVDSVRSSESVDLTMPENFTTGDSVSAYLISRRPDGSQVSNTAYFTWTI